MVQCYNGMCGDEGTCTLGDMCPVQSEIEAYWRGYFGTRRPYPELTQEQRAELRGWDRGNSKEPEWLDDDM